MSSEIDQCIERVERAAKIFSETISLAKQIESRIREREEKRSTFDALIELANALLENIEDIEKGTEALDALASTHGRRLNSVEAARLERALKFAMANLTQIGETLATANQIAGSRFPVAIALLRSLENEYNDLLTILRSMRIPSPESPEIDPGISSDLGLLRRKRERAAAEVKRVESKLQELRGK